MLREVGYSEVLNCNWVVVYLFVFGLILNFFCLFLDRMRYVILVFVSMFLLVVKIVRICVLGEVFLGIVIR